MTIAYYTDDAHVQETNLPDPEFIPFFKKIHDYAKLENNWDSYGAVAPNEWAIVKSNEILGILQEMEFVPSDVLPSAENGIGIIFKRGNRYADIECLNHGTILAVKSDGKGEPQAWEVSGIRNALRQIRKFIETTAS